MLLSFVGHEASRGYISGAIFKSEIRGNVSSIVSELIKRKNYQFGLVLNQSAVEHRLMSVWAEPWASISFKKAIDKIQPDNFKTDWTAGDTLPNLRLVRDATVQLSIELKKSLGCSATIQITKMMVNLYFKTQNSFLPKREETQNTLLTVHTTPSKKEHSSPIASSSSS